MALNINWCMRANNGLELVEANENTSRAYLKMAEESLEQLKKLDSKIWISSASYYTMYYCLYAFMMKIGVKCEIHACSLLFMKAFLKKFYSEKDIEMINEASKARSDLQYYPDKGVLDSTISRVSKYASDFYTNTIAAFSKIKESDIKLIRDELLKQK